MGLPGMGVSMGVSMQHVLDALDVVALHGGMGVLDALRGGEHATWAGCPGLQMSSWAVGHDGWNLECLRAEVVMELLRRAYAADKNVADGPAL